MLLSQNLFPLFIFLAAEMLASASSQSVFVLTVLVAVFGSCTLLLLLVIILLLILPYLSKRRPKTQMNGSNDVLLLPHGTSPYIAGENPYTALEKEEPKIKQNVSLDDVKPSVHPV